MQRRRFDQYEPFLCHYTSRYAAMAHILPMRLLRLSPFGLMRDPLEAKDRYIGMKPSPEFDWRRMLEDANLDVNERLNDVVKHEFKLLSLTADRSGSEDGQFGRGYARPRMWDQYAEGHRGVCLMFSEQELTETISRQLHDFRWSQHGLVHYRTMTEGLQPDPQIDTGRFQRAPGSGGRRRSCQIGRASCRERV